MFGCRPSFNHCCALHSIFTEFLQYLCFGLCVSATFNTLAPLHSRSQTKLYSSNASLSWLFTFFIAYIAASADLDFISSWLRGFCNTH